MFTIDITLSTPLTVSSLDASNSMSTYYKSTPFILKTRVYIFIFTLKQHTLSLSEGVSSLGEERGVFTSGKGSIP